MAGMAGFELAVRVLGIRPGCPFILISSYVREQDLATAAQAGVRHLIAKPDTVAELKQTLHEMLSQTSASDSMAARSLPSR